ncbi:GIY-YIG nuclease family protein [Devosia sp.]|uniref:GIY-YIG nuclease family protein n=1 Tax=Devosia sp. TaxID=1871048 RepID=UPI001A03E66B|nr:GIY-YIG nuclease family protein [Devosia sp.]MBE0580520.1 GIY-YIG nuclease family protein [Devosia sp.]
MLTETEKSFLQSQGLSESDVYDARGQSSASWKAGVRVAGLSVVLGSPCNNGGHRLRTRSGHCVQCDTSKLSYQKRHHSEGYVYIAGSQKAQVIKVGTAVDIDQRERNLRGQSYAGISDWTMLFSVKVDAGGKIEGEVLRDLNRIAISRAYEKDGRQQDAGEVLRTDFTTALNAMFRALKQVKFDEPWRSSAWSEYDW